MTIPELLWNIVETAAIAGLCLFTLSFAVSLVARKWRLANWRRNFGDDVLKVVNTKRSILKQSAIVAATIFGLFVVVGLLNNIPCINAMQKNKQDYLSYCSPKSYDGD